jgi:hypothetical protein
MKKVIFLFLSLFSISAHSQSQIAGCENLKGYVYYPYVYPVPKNKSGWVQDSITGGKSVLVKRQNGQLDILFTDSNSKTPISSIDDGGDVILLGNSPNRITVLVSYDKVTEIYTYWRTDDGQLQVSLLQSKSGTVPKSGLLIGSCQFINFNFREIYK